jgi:hypothetical protein
MPNKVTGSLKLIAPFVKQLPLHTHTHRTLNMCANPPRVTRGIFIHIYSVINGKINAKTYN